MSWWVPLVLQGPKEACKVLCVASSVKGTVAMLQRQSPGESPYQHQKSACWALASNGGPQQVYILGKPLRMAVDLLLETETVDCSCQAIPAKRYGHGPKAAAGDTLFF